MKLTTDAAMAMAVDPARIFDALGYAPDPWQIDLLRNRYPRAVLNCCRQAGKSTVVAALALHEALFNPGSLTLLLSKAQRQSSELFRKVVEFYNALDRPVPPIGESKATYLELANGSRIISLPGKEANIRSYSKVALLIIDEAARVPDDLYRGVRPMMAVNTKARVICLSTPFGRRGFFWEMCVTEKGWKQFTIPATSVPRITPKWLAEEKAELGESWYRQEYECAFDSIQGLVYPHMKDCLVDMEAAKEPCKRIGGLDFGFRDPCAAVWGLLDAGGILWITNEHYERGWTLPRNAAALPKDVSWYADPSGASDISEMREVGFKVNKAFREIRPGIAAVTSRIESGRLKIVRGACPNLIAEAALYAHPPIPRHGLNAEIPLDENNHALDALRYLISRVDKRFVLNYTRQGKPTVAPLLAEPAVATGREGNWWMRKDNPNLWRNV